MIGGLLARRFVELGHRVAFTGRSSERVAKLGEELGANAHALVADLAEDGAAGRLAERLAGAGLHPTVLVNCARDDRALELPDTGLPSREAWLREFVLDVVVPYELTMALALAPGSRLESVVNLASMYGIVAPQPGLYDDFARESPVHYGVAKAAVIQLSRELAVRLTARNIRVNTISYGGVAGRVDAAFEERYADRSVQRRMLAEEDVVGPAVFLATAASSGMTGHNLVVDGGWTIW
jgi:NAD(P)-dependent dehydrogenase (short-subunit alcohol dehydrogenase family)